MEINRGRGIYRGRKINRGRGISRGREINRGSGISKPRGVNQGIGIHRDGARAAEHFNQLNQDLRQPTH